MQYPKAHCSIEGCAQPAVAEVVQPIEGQPASVVSMHWLCARHNEPDVMPALTEQPSFIKGMHAECILQQRPLFEGGLDKGKRREKPNPEQGELFQ